MTKQDLARKVGVTSQVIDAVVDGIKQSLEQGESVFLRGFGTFSAKQRAEKKCRNISKGTDVIVPAHKVPHFKPCKEFKDALK